MGFDSGTLIAILICVLVAAIVLKATKKVIGTICLILFIFLLMKYAVPLVM